VSLDGDREVLRVEDLRVIYDTPAGPVRAVDGVSFSLRAGERMGLIGESGSGKTTLGTAVVRLHRPPARIVSGSVTVDGRDVLRASESEMRQLRMREIALIPQAAMNSLNPVMRVGDQVADGILAHEGRLGRRQLAERLMRALAQVGLPGNVVGRYPHQLSGGQRQRAAMAIATALQPKIIVADEPVSMVDASLRATILASLQVLNRDLGISIIYITHDLTTAYQICQNIVVLYLGTVAEAGAVERVIRDPKHPYTQLLVSSIPVANRRRRWGEDAPADGEPTLSTPRIHAGCPFAPRCPAVMDMCWQSPPRLFMPDAHRAAACFLHRDAPVLDSPDVAHVFPSPVGAERAAQAVS
jgi:peptide/nickel transport system ATP-binding protein